MSLNPGKIIFVTLGFFIFLWGIIIPEWIRMVGGIALMFLGAMLEQ